MVAVKGVSYVSSKKAWDVNNAGINSILIIVGQAQRDSCAFLFPCLTSPMPELPEVETVVRCLRPQLEGRTIAGFRARWPRVTAPALPEDFARQVAGRNIHAVRRRGKYILFDLDRGHIHLHLRMMGRLLVLPDRRAADQPHVTAEFKLSDLSGRDSVRLVFQDMRKFGRVGYLEDLAPLEARLGPEPLSSRFTPRAFHRLLPHQVIQVPGQRLQLLDAFRRSRGRVGLMDRHVTGNHTGVHSIGLGADQLRLNPADGGGTNRFTWTGLRIVISKALCSRNHSTIGVSYPPVDSTPR